MPAISTTLIVLSGIYGCLNDDNKETCDMAYQTVNPANNQLIKEYPQHTDADIEAALQKLTRSITRLVQGRD